MIELLSEPSDDTDDFSEFTKSELLEYAEQHGIDGVNSSMLKAEIYDTIVNS